MAMIQQNGKSKFVSDINVTPLVDVMLVLLIIFMITAPMMTQGVDVELPETTAQSLPQEEKPITISINRSGEIFFDRDKGNRKFIREQLAILAKIDKQRQVLLRADRQVAYGIVVSVMADIKAAGFDKLGMITQPEEQNL
ncbi:MAG: protein TolR [Deltaproteobacteria bacterium RIFOXYD12_FULL_50_9]|nr:MAG: protein TolR [Deltaproteobacteria bacterium RIFOXYD12_FULL_50_9]